MRLTSILMLSTLIAFGTAAQAESSVTLAIPVGYAADHTVQSNVKAECNISAALVEGLTAKAQTIGVNLATTADPGIKGQQLVIEITDAQSAGNAFIGHRKSVTVKGTLKNNGQPVGNFLARRVSGGGVLGGYKGSCAIIHACARVIGEDVGAWLVAPSENARLGDLN